ncbi:MAG TPA: hypothetical protein VJA21_28140 [Verrucomicrobiae bacterium]
MRSGRTIIVSGMVAANPWQGGATWAVLQYVLGFRKLGDEVCLLEPIPEKDLQPRGCGLADSDNAAYFGKVMQDFDLGARAALLVSGTQESYGLSYSSVEKVMKHADVLINISGMLTDERLLKAVPIRVYLDLDPAFSQLWNSAEGIDMRYAGHTHYVTIGLNIGEADCPVPTCGLGWLKTLQPVCLDRWPVAADQAARAFTTVGNWRGYGSITHEGVQYGQKAHSVRQLLEVPKLTAERITPALAIHPGETEDLARLRQHGWELLDPAQVARTPADYRTFIQESKAEFGICKSGYAVSRCGWFSDRSVCYLASGRPVIAQNTGFDRHMPCGKGLLAFANAEEAVAAITSVNGDYEGHRRAARQIAEEYFDSNKVLGGLLARVGA